MGCLYSSKLKSSPFIYLVRSSLQHRKQWQKNWEQENKTDLWLMAVVASCLAAVLPVKLKAAQDTGMTLLYGRINGKQQEILGFHALFHNSSTARRYCVITKAAPTPSNPNSKPNSVICADCDGNGAVLCSQCKGSGVNSVDFFNGQFKAGDSCWLCGGKKDMLCGNCNGAGFIGGFMSTFDE